MKLYTIRETTLNPVIVQFTHLLSMSGQDFYEYGLKKKDINAENRIWARFERQQGDNDKELEN